MCLFSKIKFKLVYELGYLQQMKGNLWGSLVKGKRLLLSPFAALYLGLVTEYIISNMLSAPYQRYVVSSYLPA